HSASPRWWKRKERQVRRATTVSAAHSAAPRLAQEREGVKLPALRRRRRGERASPEIEPYRLPDFHTDAVAPGDSYAGAIDTRCALPTATPDLLWLVDRRHRVPPGCRQGGHV